MIKHLIYLCVAYVDEDDDEDKDDYLEPDNDLSQEHSGDSTDTYSSVQESWPNPSHFVLHRINTFDTFS